jgi:PPP family 3-phenylpropionic acid transporter
LNPIKLLAPKLYYLCWFGALGSVLPFLPLHYRNIGLDIAQIGVVASLASLIGIFASPLWSIIADAFRIHHRLLPLGILSVLVCTSLLRVANDFSHVVLLACAQAFLSAPVIALADSGVLKALGERRDQYGKQRLFGSVGWSVAAYTSGVLIARAGMPSIFFVFAVCMVIAYFASARLPRAEYINVDLRKDAMQLMRNRDWFLFLTCCFFISCALLSTTSIQALFFQDIGLGTDTIGLANSLTAGIEIPIMFLSTQLMQRLNPNRLLMIVPLLYFCAALIWHSTRAPFFVLTGNMLIGVGFALFWTNAVIEVQRIAPKGLTATAQSLLGLAVFSLSQLIAGATYGFVYQNFGFLRVFEIGMACAAIGFLGMLFRTRALRV